MHGQTVARFSEQDCYCAQLRQGHVTSTNYPRTYVPAMTWFVKLSLRGEALFPHKAVETDISERSIRLCVTIIINARQGRGWERGARRRTRDEVKPGGKKKKKKIKKTKTALTFEDELSRICCHAGVVGVRYYVIHDARREFHEWNAKCTTPGRRDVNGKHDVDGGSPTSAEEIVRHSPPVKTRLRTNVRERCIAIAKQPDAACKLSRKEKGFWVSHSDSADVLSARRQEGWGIRGEKNFAVLFPLVSTATNWYRYVIPNN